MTAILTTTKTWRRELAGRPATDLSPEEEANVKRAVAYLRIRLGGLTGLAKAMGVTQSSAIRASAKGGRVSVRMAFRAAKAAGVGLDSVLMGEFPPVGACPHCERP